MPIVLAAVSLSLLAWLAILGHPARPWMLRPRAEEQPPPSEPPVWPSVRVVVPARNEARCLRRTLPALLAQDYPGEWAVRVVDDCSEDATAAVAGAAGADVVAGRPVPDGWAGKVWALEQGARDAGVDYLLLTDADIRHAPGSLRRLVAEAVAGKLAINSRMARLHCRTPAERLLVPPFLFFFNLLYPMAWANAGRRPAAAGGCLLVRRSALERSGGFRAICDAVIDDLNLARRVGDGGGTIRLALSSRDVESVREHPSVADVWRMVARTAFAELRYSWLRLAGALVVLALLFALPVAAVVIGALVGAPFLAALGVAAWLVQACVFVPSVRFFGVRAVWALTLPFAGMLFAGMTVDSALRRRPVHGRRTGGSRGSNS